MSEFRFSDAARLYAQNADVVDLMWKAFKESIAEFLDLLREEVRRQIEPRELIEWRNDRYRSWRIAKKAGASKENLHVAFDEEAHQTIIPGQLLFWVGSQKKNITNTIVDRIHSLSQDPEMMQYYEKKSRDKYELLIGRIVFNDKNPVEAAAPIIASCLIKVAAACEEA